MLRVLSLCALAVLLAGCGNKAVAPDGSQPSPKAVTRKPSPSTPYKPKPGETVIEFSFVTQDTAQGNGNVYIKLFTADAPKSTSHILDLVKQGYYKDILVHRIELRSDFKLTQFGNAGTKSGNPDNITGDSGTTVPLEVNKHKHVRGAVGMARAQDPNSGDSEMYICFVDIPNLDSGYAIIGEVVQGLDIAEGLGKGSKIVDCTVVQDARKSKG